MDIEYPYATGQARRQLLYRLPSAPLPRRLLVFGDKAQADLIRAGWDGSVVHIAANRVAGDATEDDLRVDAVVLSSASDNDMQKLLAAAWRRLGPGGIVMGHALDPRWVRRPKALHDAILAAGFVEPACYYLQPGIEAPMVLAPTDGPAARAHAVRAIRTTRGLYNRAAYALRLAAAWLGLDRWRQAELFFWGRRPC